MLPKIAELEFNMEPLNRDLPPIGKSFLYDFDKGEFAIKYGRLVEIRGLAVLKQWIEKVLKTEKFRFRIYDGVEYGVALEDLIGSNLPRAYIEAEIMREVTESLLHNIYIQGVEEWDFERDGKRMRIFFRVITVEGAFDMEVINGV